MALTRLPLAQFLLIDYAWKHFSSAPFTQVNYNLWEKVNVSASLFLSCLIPYFFSPRSRSYYINYLTKAMQLEDPRIRYRQLQNEHASTESIPYCTQVCCWAGSNRAEIFSFVHPDVFFCRYRFGACFFDVKRTVFEQSQLCVSLCVYGG